MMSLVSVLQQRYGVGPLAADPNTILWAAEFLAEHESVERAKNQLKLVNEIRRNQGKVTVFVPYGHKLF
jgi:hypothetical protein